MVELSVVLPVYKCKECLTPLYERLSRVLTKIVPSYEIIFVEDGGNDGSWELIEKIARKDHKVKAFQLSRNFGQHKAIAAGLSQACGKWTVVMDSDLQDPPEEIPRLYEKILSGYDIVFAKREVKQHSFFRKTASKFYFKALNFLNKSNVDNLYGSLSILSKNVVSAFLRVKDTDHRYFHVLHWLGFKIGTIEYRHAKRYSGKSSYTAFKLLKVALSGLFRGNIFHQVKDLPSFFFSKKIVNGQHE